MVDLEQSGQHTSPRGQDWSATKQSCRYNTAKNGGPLHRMLGKMSEHNDDDDDDITFINVYSLFMER